jgi:hypothetical protein
MRRFINVPLAVGLLAILSSGLIADRSLRGMVRLQGRALADAGGPFNALGTTLFWALWGESRDPDRLDKNLTWLAARGVDYVRILGMVGGESWEDRTIDPASPDYWPTVDRLLNRLASHGLRAQVTLFAEADDMMPDRTARERFVDRWAEIANAHPERFVMLEIANEHAQNGIEDITELRALGSRLARGTSVLVALSAPVGGRECEVYAGSAADLATVHYSREEDDAGSWASVREPWKWPQGFDDACPGRLPPAVNNEPIGPQSSVAADDDPLRLAMAYVMTFVAGNAAYVLHTGAGVRGGGAGDAARGRPANIFEVSRIEQTLTAIAAARGYLPAGLANWSRLDPASEQFPFEGIDRLPYVYASTNRNGFVVALLDVRAPLELRARRAMNLEVRKPLEAARSRNRIEKGGIVDLTGSASYVLIVEPT